MGCRIPVAKLRPGNQLTGQPTEHLHKSRLHFTSCSAVRNLYIATSCLQDQSLAECDATTYRRKASIIIFHRNTDIALITSFSLPTCTNMFATHPTIPAAGSRCQERAYGSCTSLNVPFPSRCNPRIHPEFVSEHNISCFTPKNFNPLSVQWTQNNSKLDDRFSCTRGREGKSLKGYHIRRTNPVLPCTVGCEMMTRCRNRACELRRVDALRVFYSNFGSQGTAKCKSRRIKMPSTVSKLKGKTAFSLKQYMLIQTVYHLASPCSFYFLIHV
jgi:hypothetical protein